MSRTKGSANRVTGDVKDNLLAVFEMVGGREKFSRWAKAHLSEFYNLYAKLLPRNIIAEVTHNLPKGPNAEAIGPKLTTALTGRSGAEDPKPTLQ